MGAPILMRMFVCMIGSVDDLDFRFTTGPGWSNPRRNSNRDFMVVRFLMSFFVYKYIRWVVHIHL